MPAAGLLFRVSRAIDCDGSIADAEGFEHRPIDSKRNTRGPHAGTFLHGRRTDPTLHGDAKHKLVRCGDALDLVIRSSQFDFQFAGRRIRCSHISNGNAQGLGESQV